MTINCGGKLLPLSSPAVMGILNLTPDSFYNGGALATEKQVLEKAEQMLSEGAALLDLGGMSSRPGATIISAQEELVRVLPAIRALRHHFPQAILSIDTIHALTADEACRNGCCIINDISAGRYDNDMLFVAVKHRAVFIAMHMQGLPADMQQQPHYQNLLQEIMQFLSERISRCRKAGILDVLIDPGFGFGKTTAHNYILLKNLSLFRELGVPLLVGLSRKNMIYKTLGTTPQEALNGTTAAHALALTNGAQLLRVHDVKEAVEAIKIFTAYQGTESLQNPQQVIY